MGISREGAGMLYRYIFFPLGIFVFFASLFGAFGEDSEVMMVVGIGGAILGYFGPKIFN